MQSFLRAIPLLATLSVIFAHAQQAGLTIPNSSTSPSPRETLLKEQIATQWAGLPLSFEANRGQAQPGVDFLTNGYGHSVLFSQGSATVLIKGSGPRGAGGKELERRMSPRPNGNESVVRIRLAGADSRAAAVALEPLPGKSDYLAGNDATRWIMDVPHFGRIQYTRVYPGIDLIYYGSGGRLESDFVLASGADPKVIRLSIEGAERCELNRDGDLLIHADGSEIRLKAPAVYQKKRGEQHKIAGAFHRVGKSEFGFKVGTYNKSAPLVIDPVLSYSTYLGGTGNDLANAVAVDSSGNAYIAGGTTCCVPVTAGAFETTIDHNGAGFITKLDASGSTLIYSTYLYSSMVRAITVDSNGNVYATGSAANGFPTTPGAYQSSGAGSVAFVAKLNAQGNGLVYGTLLGPPKQLGIFAETTYGNGIAVDKAGEAYVTGTTLAPNFPTTPSAYDATCGSDGLCNPDNYGNPTQDGFVAKINAQGNALVYSTYLGGTGDDYGAAIGIDASGDAYVTGPTVSPDFPVSAGAFQTTPAAGVDSFVTKLNSSGSGLIYSTFLAGDGDDWAHALAVDSGGNAYIAGSSSSTDFPTTSGAFQPGLDVSPLGGAPDAFITKLNPSGGGIVFSTYLGGTGADAAYALALDSALNVYVVGSTNGADFPVQKPFQAYCLTCPNFDTSFVSELDTTGSRLIYSSFLGGGHSNGADDEGQGIAVDRNGNAYVTGVTTSFDYPAVNAYQPENAGPNMNTDAFLTKISPADGDVVFLSPALTTFPSQPVNSTSSPLKVDVRNLGNVSLAVSGIEIRGDFKQTNDCGSSVGAGEYCSVTVEFAPTAAGNRTGVVMVTDSSLGSTHTSSLAGTGIIAPLLQLSTYNLSFGNQAAGTTSSPQTVTVTNGGSADLDFTNILILAPFKQGSSTCGASLAPLKSCALAIVFAPIQAGGFTGEILFSTNDTTSTAVISLSGTGTQSVPPDYTLNASPPSSTVVSGGTATYTLTLMPAGGFNQAVGLSCSGAPTASTCAISPSNIGVDGVNASQVSVTVKTTQHTYSNAAIAVVSGLNIAGGLALWSLSLWFGSRKRSLLFRKGLLVLVAALILSAVTACGGGGSNPQPRVEHGTPPGTYSIVVSGTSTGIPDHSITLTLQVQ